MNAEQALTVREMQLGEVGVRINYFHGSSDEHLRMLGVDRALLPTRDAGCTRRITRVRFASA
jgi:hypothetical protein